MLVAQRTATRFLLTLLLSRSARAIIVWHWQHNTFHVNIKDSSLSDDLRTIHDLKGAIYRKKGIEAGSQHLEHNGEPLDQNDATLSDLGIRVAAACRVVPRRVGCPRSQCMTTARQPLARPRPALRCAHRRGATHQLVCNRR